MTPDFRVFWQYFDVWIHRTLKSWTKPATALLIAGGIADLKRKRADLILENELLRQQLIVLNRQVKRSVGCKNLIRIVYAANIPSDLVGMSFRKKSH